MFVCPDNVDRLTIETTNQYPQSYLDSLENTGNNSGKPFITLIEGCQDWVLD